MRAVGWVFLSFRVLAALWVGAIAVIAGLQSLGYMNPAPKLEPLAWGVSLAVIGLESVGSIVRERYENVLARRQVDLDRWSLLFVLEQLSDGHQQRGLNFEDLGVSVWVPTVRSRIACWARRLPREQHKFKRLNRFRPEGYPQQSAMTWTGSMGTLGECWRDQKDRYWNSHAVASRYGSAEITQLQFDKMSPAVKRGFSREQFSRIVGKYSEVRAIPVMHNDTSKGKMIGVLTIDRVFAGEETPFIAHLDDKRTLRRAEAAAAGAARTIAGKRHDS